MMLKLSEGKPNSEWTSAQIDAIQTRFLNADEKRRKKLLNDEQLREQTIKLAVQVVAEFESAHENLSEEGSMLWLDAFDRIRKINLVSLL